MRSPEFIVASLGVPGTFALKTSLHFPHHRDDPDNGAAYIVFDAVAPGAPTLNLQHTVATLAVAAHAAALAASPSSSSSPKPSRPTSARALRAVFVGSSLAIDDHTAYLLDYAVALAENGFDVTYLDLTGAMPDFDSALLPTSSWPRLATATPAHRSPFTADDVIGLGVDVDDTEISTVLRSVGVRLRRLALQCPVELCPSPATAIHRVVDAAFTATADALPSSPWMQAFAPLLDVLTDVDVVVTGWPLNSEARGWDGRVDDAALLQQQARADYYWLHLALVTRPSVVRLLVVGQSHVAAMSTGIAAADAVLTMFPIMPHTAVKSRLPTFTVPPLVVSPPTRRSWELVAQHVPAAQQDDSEHQHYCRSVLGRLLPSDNGVATFVIGTEKFRGVRPPLLHSVRLHDDAVTAKLPCCVQHLEGASPRLGRPDSFFESPLKLFVTPSCWQRWASGPGLLFPTRPLEANSREP